MSNSNLMPRLSVKNADLFTEVKNAEGEVIDHIFNIRYYAGMPRQYRADMSKAVINIKGQELITQPKDDFSFAPFAFRYFEDSLFGKEEKVWCEFFFLNEALNVCSIMFHGYTAQAFREHYADELFYDDLTVCECVFTVRFNEKKADVQEGGKTVSKTYHIGSFKSKQIDKDTRDAYRTLLDCLQPVFRADTFKETREASHEENYRMPESETAKTLRLKAAQKWTDDLLEELSKPNATEQKELNRGVNNMLNQAKRR